jgi:hypothetical protein
MSLGGGLQRVELLQLFGGNLLERSGNSSFFDIDLFWVMSCPVG